MSDINTSYSLKHVVLYFQIETTLDTISTFVVDTKTALEQLISSSNTPDKADHKNDKHKKGHVGEVLGRSLKNVSFYFARFQVFQFACIGVRIMQKFKNIFNFNIIFCAF